MSGHDAFISYSHRADDFRATALQGALQNLGRPFYRRKVLDVFRDETSLSANPALWPSIERALTKSRYFILMASPEASVSPWCTREIEWWLANRSTETFLIILTAGEYTFDENSQDFDWTRTTAIPKALRGKFPVEPFYRDLRWAQRGDNLSVTNPRFRAEVLPIAAALHGKEPQELDGEDLRQFRRTRRFWRSAAVALGILTIISAGAAWIATQKSHEATVQRDEATRQSGLALKAKKSAVKERNVAQQERDAANRARVAEQKARIEEAKQRKAAEEAQRVALEQRDEAVRQRNFAFARQLAIKAEFLQKDEPGMLRQSMLLAAESLRRAPSLEADRTLRYGLQLLPRQIAELSFNPYVDDQGLSATSNNHFAFFTVPDDELQVVQFTEGGFRQLGKWQPDRRPESIAFDPRFGERLVINTGKVWLWDLKEPAPKEVPGCEGLAAISGAERLTLACVPGPVTIVDVATGAVTEHDIRDVTGLAFDAFGEHLAMARADGSLVVAEVAPWKELFRTDPEDRNGHFYAATLVTFSTDGELVIKATGQDKSLHVREVATGKEVGTLNHPDIVLAIAFGDDGRYVATAGADGIARVFESRGGVLVAELRHLGAVRDVRFTRGDSYSGAPLLLATASEDGTARLWDIGSGREIARAAASVPIGHVIPYSVERFATLSYDGTMRLWDVGREDVDGEGILATPLAARWLPRQREFGLAYGHLTWRIDPQRKKRSNFGDARDSQAAVWSADGDTLLMGGKERSQVWNAVTQKVIADYPHGADAWALSPDGKTFAVAEEKAVKVLRVGREAPIALIPAPSSFPKAIALNSSHLAIADSSSIVVQRFDEPAAKPVTIHLHNVDKMAFSPDGRFLTWANDEFGVFDMPAGRMMWLLDWKGQRVPAGYFAFSPDGQLIAAASYNDFWIWSLPGGKLVLTGTYEGSGKTSEMKSRGRIASIAISGDDHLVAVGGTDGIASVRRIAGGAELIRVSSPSPEPGKEPAPIQAVALSDRGDYLLAASPRANRVWAIAADTLVAEACLRLRRGLTKAEWSEYLGNEAYRARCEATPIAARR